jgi:hypothetical protein
LWATYDDPRNRQAATARDGRPRPSRLDSSMSGDASLAVPPSLATSRPGSLATREEWSSRAKPSNHAVAHGPPRFIQGGNFSRLSRNFFKMRPGIMLVGILHHGGTSSACHSASRLGVRPTLAYNRMARGPWAGTAAGHHFATDDMRRGRQWAWDRVEQKSES